MSTWRERDLETGVEGEASLPRAKELTEAREAALPAIQREAERGKKPFTALAFQPVKSPGLYEGEFGKKEMDVIFHFWPYGYHEADRKSLAAPRFPTNFEKHLTDTMGASFGPHRILVRNDLDMGAFYVRAYGWSEQQFWFDLSVKACQALHKALGGSDS